MQMMRARAMTIAMTSGAILAASLLTAAPALATPTDITPTTCANEGGAFSRAKGVNTCVVNVYTIRYEYPNDIHSVTVMGPFPDPENHPAAGYYAEWRLTQGFRDTITYTQKGKKPVQSTTASELVRQTMRNQFCGSVSVTPSGTGIGFAYIVQCDSLGMYPADIYVS